MLCGASIPLYAQIVNPADKQRDIQQSSQSPTQMRDVTEAEVWTETEVRTQPAPREPAGGERTVR